MSFLKKESEPKEIIIEESAEDRFDTIMKLVKDLNREEYDKLKKAMDYGYEACQLLSEIDRVEEVGEDIDDEDLIYNEV